MVAIVLQSFAGSSTAAAHEIKLTGTVRDFKDSHPDFQTTIANDTNYVSNTLGMDGKPVYIGGAGTATTSGAANYNQWYNDVPGINMSAPIDLILTNNQATPGGLYSFSDTTFFPIDNQLFGNQGRSHNYHFTMELHTAFVYEPGLNFNVTADDDLIIFINGQKVLDLGGIHPPLSASYQVDNLGLTVGQTYSFDLFFAERHTTQSTLEFCTNIQFVPEPATMVLAAVGALAAARRRFTR